MAVYVNGDLFQSPARTLVNTVNTQGVMGKGLALTFKKLYPAMFTEYQALCESGRLQIGSLFLYRDSPKNVLNFPTKTTWKRPSTVDYIRAGLARFRATYAEMGVDSIAFPPLGCGNGELDFATQVQPLMHEYLNDLPIQVFIHPPLPHGERPEHHDIPTIKAWLRSDPGSLALDEVWQDLAERFREEVQLETLRRGNPFSVAYAPAKHALRVTVGPRSLLFTQEDIALAWSQLRYHGLLTSSGMPNELAKRSTHLLPILAELPYVEPVAVSEAYAGYAVDSREGVQLAGWKEPEHEQLSLAHAP